MAFKHNIKVSPDDIDVMGHVNNVVYVQWVQDVAEAHWKTKASLQQQEEILWVVLRHEIDYIKPAFQEDTIIGSTWVEPAEGPKTVRHVEFKRKEDNQLLAKSRTTWVAINPTTGKPTRLGEDVMRVFN
ncbi:MAG: acyl-CoA thioesterase [Candidatus Cyclobacteriaceae bacterium M2_1C_046]